MTFDDFFKPSKSAIYMEKLKDTRLYQAVYEDGPSPPHVLNTNRFNKSKSGNQITNAEISELYVKHVVIGNSVLRFARELIKKVEK